MPPRLILPFILWALLAGCAVVPQSAWTFDPAKPQPKPVADAATIARLTERIVQLQIELNELRRRIAVQDDAFKRLPLYMQEHHIHRRLAPLQRQRAHYASAR